MATTPLKDHLSIYYPRWILNYDENALLLTDRKEDTLAAARTPDKIFIGYDSTKYEVYLCNEIRAWRNNEKQVQKNGATIPKELKNNYLGEVKGFDVME